jgi:Homeobox KN domain
MKESQLFPIVVQAWRLRDQLSVTLDIYATATLLRKLFDLFDYIECIKPLKDTESYKMNVAVLAVLIRQVIDTAQSRIFFAKKSNALMNAFLSEANSAAIVKHYHVGYLCKTGNSTSYAVFRDTQDASRSPYHRSYNGLARPSRLFSACKKFEDCDDASELSAQLLNRTSTDLAEIPSPPKSACSAWYAPSQADLKPSRFSSDDDSLVLPPPVPFKSSARPTTTHHDTEFVKAYSDSSSERKRKFSTRPEKILVDDVDSDCLDSDSDDDSNGKSKFSGPVRKYLNRWLDRYQKSPYPSPRVKQHLADMCGLTPKQVYVILTLGTTIFVMVF